ADYSQYGPELDFLAPSSGGWNGITTLDPTGAVGYSTSDFVTSFDMTAFGKTSSAAPLAAGVAALLLSVNPALTATQVRDTLRQTADKIGPLAYVNGFNPEYGYGRINARAALQSMGATTIMVVASDDTASESPGNTGRFTVSRTGSTASSLNVSLVVGGTAT